MNKKIWTLNGIAFASLTLPAFTIISCGSQENISERMRQINQRFINKIEEETNNFLPCLLYTSDAADDLQPV